MTGTGRPSVVRHEHKPDPANARMISTYVTEYGQLLHLHPQSRQRTPDGRAWTTCQFLPASFKPRAPLGLMFDSVACMNRQSWILAGCTWPRLCGTVLRLHYDTDVHKPLRTLRSCWLTFRPLTTNVAMLRASSVRQFMVSSRVINLGKWRPATILPSCTQSASLAMRI